MNDEERISELRRAEELLMQSAEIIDRCMHMTGTERRFGHISDDIRGIASSDSGDSVANLVRELEYASEEHRGWTRPFASVKNVVRKDI